MTARCVVIPPWMLALCLVMTVPGVSRAEQADKTPGSPQPEKVEQDGAGMPLPGLSCRDDLSGVWLMPGRYPANGRVEDEGGGECHGRTCIGVRPWLTDGRTPLRFDGSSRNVCIPGRPALQPSSNDFSVVFWLRADSYDGDGFPHLISMRPASSATDCGWAIATCGRGDLPGVFRKLSTHFADGEQGWDVTEPSSCSASDVQIDRWQHWAVVFDRHNRKLRFYLNGALDRETSQNFPGAVNPTCDLLLGVDSPACQRPFTGELSAVAIFRRVLEEAEVAKLFQAGRPCYGEERTPSPPPAEPAKLAAYRALYADERAAICTNRLAADRARAAYQRSLGAMEVACRENGDFEGLLEIVSERQRFASSPTVPPLSEDAASPGLTWARARYREAQSAIAASHAARLDRLANSYRQALVALQENYLALGQQDEGVIVAAEINRLDNERRPLPSVESSLAPTNGLLAWYRFAGDARDASGHGLHGMARGVTPVDDRLGGAAGALEFSGKSGILIADDDRFHDLRQLSIVIWLKADQPSGWRQRNQCILGKGWLGRIEERAFNLHWDHEREGAHFFVVTTVGDSVLHPESSIDGASWHQVIATYDGAIMRLYVDGQLTGERPQEGVVVSNPAALAIGCLNDRLENGFSGCMDSLRIYTRALSEKEVAAAPTWLD